MNLQKIKAALKKDPATEFVYSQYSGEPEARFSSKAVIVSDKRYSWGQFPGYSDRSLNASDVAHIQAQNGTSDTTDYYLLVKLVRDNEPDNYVMTKPRHIKGFWADVQDLWAKELVLRKKLDQLKEQERKIIAEQTGLHHTKEKLVQQEIATMLKEIGLDDDDIAILRIRSDIQVRFANKRYPELEHLANEFRSDLDNYETTATYRVLDFQTEWILNFMEVIYDLREKNIQLAKELEREKRANEVRH